MKYTKRKRKSKNNNDQDNVQNQQIITQSQKIINVNDTENSYMEKANMNKKYKEGEEGQEIEERENINNTTNQHEKVLPNMSQDDDNNSNNYSNKEENITEKGKKITNNNEEDSTSFENLEIINIENNNLNPKINAQSLLPTVVTPSKKNSTNENNIVQENTNKNGKFNDINIFFKSKTNIF